MMAAAAFKRVQVTSSLTSFKHRTLPRHDSFGAIQTCVCVGNTNYRTPVLARDVVGVLKPSGIEERVSGVLFVFHCAYFFFR